MSEQLDAHPEWLDYVADDLGSSAATGRCGLTAESALRCALLKQYRQLTYEELAFHLLDSASFRAFARLPLNWTPKKAALQANIAAMTDTTWEAINTQLLGAARQAGVERGTMWRVDSTVIDSPIHAPTDSTLLLDGVRVMVRLLEAGAPTLTWHNHSRRAKERARAIRYTRDEDKKRALYLDQVDLT